MVLRLKTRESRSSPGLPRPVSKKYALPLRYLSAVAFAPPGFGLVDRIINRASRVIEIFPSYTIVGLQKPPRVSPRRFFAFRLIVS